MEVGAAILSQFTDKFLAPEGRFSGFWLELRSFFAACQAPCFLRNRTPQLKYSCQGRLHHGGAGYGDDADVVLLAESLGGAGYVRGAEGGAQMALTVCKAFPDAIGRRNTKIDVQGAEGGGGDDVQDDDLDDGPGEEVGNDNQAQIGFGRYLILPCLPNIVTLIDAIHR